MKVSPSHRNDPWVSNPSSDLCGQRQGSASDQRPHTRAFAKLHGLSVKDFTLEDLDAVSRKIRSRPISKPPTQSSSRSSSSLLPLSKDNQAAKTTPQPLVTSNARQTRSNKSKEKVSLQALGGPDARGLRSQKRQSLTARQGPKVQPQSRELPISLSRPGPRLEQATDTEKRVRKYNELDVIMELTDDRTASQTG